MRRQRRDIFAPFAQRRNPQFNHLDAVVEIFAEAPRIDHRFEILVGGRDDAHVDRQRLVAADALEALLLDGAQQLGLRLQAHVADLVEKQRAAVGRFELALAPRHRAGEGALLVTEQLALHQLA